MGLFARSADDGLISMGTHGHIVCGKALNAKAHVRAAIEERRHGRSRSQRPRQLALIWLKRLRLSPSLMILRKIKGISRIFQDYGVREGPGIRHDSYGGRFDKGAQSLTPRKYCARSTRAWSPLSTQ